MGGKKIFLLTVSRIGGFSVSQTSIQMVLAQWHRYGERQKKIFTLTVSRISGFLASLTSSMKPQTLMVNATVFKKGVSRLTSF